MAASILSDEACELGEGPTYDPATDTLYWFDILASRMLEKKLSGGQTRIHQLDEMASAIATIDGERQLLLTETGLHVRDATTGKLKLHMSVEAANAGTRSNDARVHPCGALWFGTMGKKAEAGAGAIYWFFRGELRLLFPAISIPNSICFSPDGKTAYYTDTAVNLLYRLDCDADTGLPLGEPKLFVDRRGDRGGIDGSVVARDGVLWNASWGGGRVDAYAPDGKLVRSVPVPAVQTSCPAFVGHAADRMAVTSAAEGMSAKARRADPHAGKTFLLDIQVNGRHEPNVLI
ncbi:SMP-30/gluconolactonase/LRE family protein [Aminobacter sp. SR38]|jgi:sugar lactone lactonase YvrE|uniref:SMP-30/gluconolactonase/LRE family protein n=1 Tax=Aminobacter sp. SR38 TaxID=2774562 RepID=UPI0017804005|nr:SMP-30/gluconolactonase/LRE family protein [Aminobacter sp. SR38]QOF69077.1 SMP-30/gluconolactonase/LRE family protein [Aminobacter sp. SR38]